MGSGGRRLHASRCRTHSVCPARAARGAPPSPGGRLALCTSDTAPSPAGQLQFRHRGYGNFRFSFNGLLWQFPGLFWHPEEQVEKRLSLPSSQKACSLSLFFPGIPGKSFINGPHGGAQVGRRRPVAEVPRAGCGGRPASADREAARRHDSPAVSRRQPPAMSLPGKSKKKVSAAAPCPDMLALCTVGRWRPRAAGWEPLCGESVPALTLRGRSTSRRSDPHTLLSRPQSSVCPQRMSSQRGPPGRFGAWYVFTWTSCESIVLIRASPDCCASRHLMRPQSRQVSTWNPHWAENQKKLVELIGKFPHSFCPVGLRL